MSDPMPPHDEAAKRRQRQRSIAIGIGLALLAVLFYALTISRFRGH